MLLLGEHYEFLLLFIPPLELCAITISRRLAQLRRNLILKTNLSRRPRAYLCDHVPPKGKIWQYFWRDTFIVSTQGGQGLTGRNRWRIMYTFSRQQIEKSHWTCETPIQGDSCLPLCSMRVDMKGCCQFRIYPCRSFPWYSKICDIESVGTQNFALKSYLEVLSFHVRKTWSNDIFHAPQMFAKSLPRHSCSAMLTFPYHFASRICCRSVRLPDPGLISLLQRLSASPMAQVSVWTVLYSGEYSISQVNSALIYG